MNRQIYMIYDVMTESSLRSVFFSHVDLIKTQTEDRGRKKGEKREWYFKEKEKVNDWVFQFIDIQMHGFQAVT